jgi:glycosyltransferase involved in cell wall biosynthesis
MKKKILFISDVPDFKGGAENSLFDLMSNPHIVPMLAVPSYGPIAKRAEERSIRVFILDFGSVLTVRRPFKILDVPRTFFAALSTARQIKKIEKDNNILCCHTNGLKAHGVACLSRLIGARPVVAHFRAIPFTGLEKMFWHAVRIIASQLVLVSRPCWHGETLPSNVKVIFNGINVASEQPPMRTPGKPFIIGFAGRIQFTKGVDTLIEWFEYAHKKGLDIKLLIRGEAAPDELDYDAKVRKMVVDKGLTELCIFEGKKEGLANIFGGIDVNAVTSVVPDPLPRSVMEACSLGLPVLGYPAGGIPYMFEDKKSGFLVDNGEQFYQIIKNLMEDNQLYQSISKGAYINAKENFTLAKLHNSVFAEYESLGK